MEDKLRVVINAAQNRSFILSPRTGKEFDLVSLKTFDISDIEDIQWFQATVKERFSVYLIVVGGGYGCTKIIFKIDDSSPEAAKKSIFDLLEDEAFRALALRAGFTVALVPEPRTRLNLETGEFSSLTYDQGLLGFCSYAHEDEKHRQRLDKHLTILKRQGLVRMWYDRQITPGTEWATAIDDHLERADIILLLVSADFLASDYCYGVEMKRALTRHDEGHARVIPIIVREVDWAQAPFEKLQVLPQDGLAITLWKSQDQAWTRVAKGIRRTIEQIMPRVTGMVAGK